RMRLRGGRRRLLVRRRRLVRGGGARRDRRLVRLLDHHVAVHDPVDHHWGRQRRGRGDGRVGGDRRGLGRRGVVVGPSAGRLVDLHGTSGDQRGGGQARGRLGGDRANA